MKFDLVRPCAKCPFRSDIPPYLTSGRILELERALVDQQQTFSCHQTVDSSRIVVEEDECDCEQAAITADTNEQHCAGALIMLERMEKPNQMMRWMERLHDKKGELFYDRRKLDMAAPVYDDFGEMYLATLKQERKRHHATKRTTPG